VILRLAVVAAVLALVGGIVYAFTATNTVPATQAGQSSQATGAANLAPAGCISRGVVPANIIVGVPNSTVNGSSAVNLMLATNGANETLNGGKGSDCLVAGSGGDTLNGGVAGGTNVCIKNGNANVTTTRCTVVLP
jgi:Ca2+-binding RTX toxin-like protein